MIYVRIHIANLWASESGLGLVTWKTLICWDEARVSFPQSSFKWCAEGLGICFVLTVMLWLKPGLISASVCGGNGVPLTSHFPEFPSWTSNQTDIGRAAPLTCLGLWNGSQATRLCLSNCCFRTFMRRYNCTVLSVIKKDAFFPPQTEYTIGKAEFFFFSVICDARALILLFWKCHYSSWEEVPFSF